MCMDETDTNDVIKKLWEIKSSSFLYSSDETGKYLLLLGPLVLQQHQQLTQSLVVLWVTEGHILESPDDHFNAEWHGLLG